MGTNCWVAGVVGFECAGRPLGRRGVRGAAVAGGAGGAGGGRGVAERRNLGSPSERGERRE